MGEARPGQIRCRAHSINAVWPWASTAPPPVGLRIRSGLTGGLAGAAIGLHWSLALSSAALSCGALVTAAYARSGHPAGSVSAPR